MAELAYASDLGSDFCRFESYYGYEKRFVYTRQERNVQNWGYRIAAIAADCKSAPSGSVVRVHLSPPNELPSSVVNWTFLVIEGVYKLCGHKDDYGKRIMLLITYR